jgi:hypothetical protein
MGSMPQIEFWATATGEKKKIMPQEEILCMGKRPHILLLQVNSCPLPDGSIISPVFQEKK